jgi:hypothetical protein
MICLIKGFQTHRDIPTFSTQTSFIPCTITMSSSSEPSETFKQGIKIRREVLGDAYVDKALAGVRCDPLVASPEKQCHSFIQHSSLDSHSTGLGSICKTRTGVCYGSVLG